MTSLGIRGANVRLLKNPTDGQIRYTLEALRSSGANAVAFNRIMYCSLSGTDITTPPAGQEPYQLFYADHGQDPLHPFNNTCDIDTMYSAAEIALYEFGFERVIARVLVDSYDASWRGNITVPPELTLAVAAQYDEYVLAPLLPMVKALGLDLSIGAELVKFSENRMLGAQFWIDRVNWLRSQGVTQRLTYGANWGWGPDAEYWRLLDLWEHLDYASIDMYTPMCNQNYTGPITVDLLLHGWQQNLGWNRRLADDNGVPQMWCPTINYDHRQFQAEIGKELFYAEIGYGDTWQADLDPAGDTDPGERTTAVQDVLYEAARENAEIEGVISGWFTWEAGCAQTVGSTHDILGTRSGDIAWHE